MKVMPDNTLLRCSSNITPQSQPCSSHLFPSLRTSVTIQNIFKTAQHQHQGCPLFSGLGKYPSHISPSFPPPLDSHPSSLYDLNLSTLEHSILLTPMVINLTRPGHKFCLFQQIGGMLVLESYSDSMVLIIPSHSSNI